MVALAGASRLHPWGGDTTMANHPNRTKANRARRITRECRFWAREIAFFDRELANPERQQFKSEIESKRRAAVANLTAWENVV